VREILDVLHAAAPGAAPPPGREAKVAEKTGFSSLCAAGIPEELKASGARSVLICGIETHVCVNQTVHDLLGRGYHVQVAMDAVESRHAVDREAGLRKMERSGAILTTCEMAAFELLRDAKHPRFKEVQALFK
jgi:nicotinamidase-related amidase